MRRAWLAIAIMAIAPAASCTRGPKGLSRAAYPAIEKGVAALNRAYEYRDAGTIVFEPRMLDAERALDETRAAGSKNANDASAQIILQESIKMLAMYREARRTLERIEGESTPQYGKARKEFSQPATDESLEIAKGIANLKSYL